MSILYSFQWGFRGIAATVITSAFLSFSAGAQSLTVYGDTADNAVLYSPDTDPQELLSAVNNDTDEVGYNGGLERNFVFVFQLPSLPSGEAISSASFSAYVAYNSLFSGNIIDLWGLPDNASSTVQTSDFFDGVNDPDATLIQQDYADASTPESQLDTTSAAGDSALANYLNDLYLNGSVAGDYVFLRANREIFGGSYSVMGFDTADLAPYLASVYSSEGYGTYDENLAYYEPMFSPQLNITFSPVPEPKALCLFAIAGIMAAGWNRRRTSRQN